MHTTEAFSKHKLEADDEFVQDQVRETLFQIGFDVSNAKLTAHRWRYAFVDKPMEKAFWSATNWHSLLLAGDFCLGSTITNAALSGLSASKYILEMK